MKFVRCGNQHGVDVFPPHHPLETGAGMFDFQFIRNLSGAFDGAIGDCNHLSNPRTPSFHTVKPQPSLQHETPYVLRVPFTDEILAL